MREGEGGQLSISISLYLSLRTPSRTIAIAQRNICTVYIYLLSSIQLHQTRAYCTAGLSVASFFTMPSTVEGDGGLVPEGESDSDTALAVAVAARVDAALDVAGADEGVAIGTILATVGAGAESKGVNCAVLGIEVRAAAAVMGVGGGWGAEEGATDAGAMLETPEAGAGAEGVVGAAAGSKADVAKVLDSIIDAV